jgi:hypothetical protein
MSARISSDVLNRFVRPEEPDLSPAMAQHIVGFELTDAEREHLEKLADKSESGTLTPGERSDYESLVLLGEFLTLMKCKAHLFLQRQSPAA